MLRVSGWLEGCKFRRRVGKLLIGVVEGKRFSAARIHWPSQWRRDDNGNGDSHNSCSGKASPEKPIGGDARKCLSFETSRGESFHNWGTPDGWSLKGCTSSVI